MMQPTKFWADVCRHIDREDLSTIPGSPPSSRSPSTPPRRSRSSREAIATRTLPEWSERFATLAGPWAPVQDTLQAADDAQVLANEYIVRAGELELVANPVQFDVSGPAHGTRAGLRRADRRGSAWSSAWTGTASSSSRRQAPSPR